MTKLIQHRSTPSRSVKNYSQLVNQIRREIDTTRIRMVDFVQRQTTETYWRIGRFTSEHLLANKEKANYGEHLFGQLAKDVGIGSRTLHRAVAFYRAYPIVTGLSQLNWSHFQQLSKIKDPKEREALTRNVILKNWDAETLEEKIKTERLKAVNSDPDVTEIPKLPFDRGELNTYQIVNEEAPFLGNGSTGDALLLIDCGFQIRHPHAGLKRDQFNEGDRVRWEKGQSSGTLQKSPVEKKSLFTFAAKVERVVDADTFLLLIDCGFNIFIRQRLRLRGLDAPELSTEEGQKAKQFVQRQLRPCPVVVVKTYKADKYDRYLTDLFYLSDETDPQTILTEGAFLNQELLNHGHARMV